MNTTALFQHPLTTVTPINPAKPKIEHGAKAAQIYALHAEAQALVANHRKLAEELYASLQVPDLTPEGRLRLERRYESHMETLRQEMAQLAIVSRMIDALNAGRLGPAERDRYAAALRSIEMPMSTTAR